MLLSPLTDLVAKAFAAQNLPTELGRVITADRPDLADVQCNGALQGAKLAGKAPRAIAESIVAELQKTGANIFSEISIAGPGFINFKIKPEYLAKQLAAQDTQEKFGFVQTKPEKVIVDYCGVNIAKAIHVGHMRPTIIGDAIKRLYRFADHDVIGDVHLGDWGLPMGIVINEVMREQPDLPYFNDDYTGEYPKEPPFSLSDLARLYPQGSIRTKDDQEERKKVRIITAKLQDGHPGYRALWRHIVNVSLIDIRMITDFLDVHFDYWYGESDAHPYIAAMIDDLKQRNLAVMSEGALVVHVAKEDDNREMPPIILVKTDGGVTYGTTDLATIVQRQKDFKPDQIVYVFDQRQDLHITQVFRAAEMAGFAPQAKLHFAGFGTMNGKDGKPFKTRDGGIPTLREFMDTLIDKAAERLHEVGLGEKLSQPDFKDTAEQVGLAAMKYGDLMNSPRSDYIFDIDKFVSFEGKTGPYIQYTIVRVNTLLGKATEQNIHKGDFVVDPVYHDVALLLLQFPNVIEAAVADYAPNVLAEYLFRLAQSVNKFYQTVPVLIEPDEAKRGAALAVLSLSARILTTGLDLLGIKVPKQM
jgi:arginyl-tRNA synthetase